MTTDKRTADILENIGVLMKSQSASDSWTQIKTGVNHKDEYDASQAAPAAPPTATPTGTPAGGNGRSRKKTTQNKAQVHLKEIAQILKKYA